MLDKLMLFDLNNTLVDNSKTLKVILARFAQTYNLSKGILRWLQEVYFTAIQSPEWVKQNFLETFPDLTLADLDRYLTQLEAFNLQLQQRPLQTHEVYPDWLRTLPQLISRGWLLGIVTRASREVTQRILSEQQLVDYFTLVKTHTDCEELGIRNKPSPEILAVILAEVNVNLNRVYYVGDSASDIEFARAGGIHSVWAAYDSSETDMILRRMPPEFTIHRPQELLLLA